MRRLVCLFIVLGIHVPIFAQENEPRRFGFKQYPELYPQDTPKKAFASVMDAIEKDRYDYLVAHLFDPDFINEQLATTYAFHEKLARDKAEQDGLLKSRNDLKQVRARIADIAAQLNFDYLVRRMRTKHTDDPQSLKELRQMLSEGAIQENGDAATIRLKDLKDRAVYLKRIGDRWFVENRIGDALTEK